MGQVIRTLVGAAIVLSLFAVSPLAQVRQIGSALLPVGCAVDQVPVQTSTPGVWGCGSGGGGNPFDQDLNTTDSVQFVSLSLNSSGNAAIAPLSLRGGGSAGAYTVTNSGIVFTDAAGHELWRLWSGDWDFDNNYNSGNTYFGYRAGADQPSDNVDAASGNVGIGAQALESILTGAANVAIGRFALNNLESGNSNVAIGFATLINAAVTSQSDNIAIGTFALAQTQGSQNVGIGSATMQHATGDDNVSAGYLAATFIADGSTTLELANQSVYIGSKTKALVDNPTNEMVVGYDAIGHGSNTATWGNTSITAHYFSGSLQIAASGASLSAASGVLTMAGLSGTAENLTWDFSSANVVTVGTGTGVTKIDFGTQILEGKFNSSDGSTGCTGTPTAVKDGIATTCAEPSFNLLAELSWLRDELSALRRELSALKAGTVH